MMRVETVEQYEAAQALFLLLHKLNIKTAAESADMCDGEYGNDFNRCDSCDTPRCDCVCEQDGPNYNIYDDESSFE